MSFFTKPDWQTDPDTIKELAQRIGMKAKEVIRYCETNDGVIIQDFTGFLLIILSKPDSLGRPAGSLLAVYPPGVQVPSSIQLPIFESDDTPRLTGGETFDELVGLATAVKLPGIATRSRFDAVTWIGEDAQRAVAVWAWQAELFEVPLQDVVKVSELAEHCRDVCRRAGVEGVA